MDPRLHALALRKQSLQLRAASQRADASWRLEGIEAALERADRLRDHLQRSQPVLPVLMLATATLLATRPRLALRLGKRAWLGWLLMRRLRTRSTGGLTPLLAPLAQLLLKTASRKRGEHGRRIRR